LGGVACRHSRDATYLGGDETKYVRQWITICLDCYEELSDRMLDERDKQALTETQ
jgi:hypothetical protein